MTGLLPPTSGDACIFGYSLVDELAAIRQMLGVCPQHDVLYDLLTVKEHLELFCVIKDVKATDKAEQVDKMIQLVSLTEKTDAYASALSGGMKRKLSVAIALLGDSKVVFLDEPTSGMDVYSRRAIWAALKKAKEGRVIILTTHFMVRGTTSRGNTLQQTHTRQN